MTNGYIAGRGKKIFTRSWKLPEKGLYVMLGPDKMSVHFRQLPTSEEYIDQMVSAVNCISSAYSGLFVDNADRLRNLLRNGVIEVHFNLAVVTSEDQRLGMLDELIDLAERTGRCS